MPEWISQFSVRKRNARLLLASTVALYVVVFSVLSIARYNTYHAATFDLGIMSQVTWNTAHGRLFETSIDRATNTDLIGSYLGNHVRPILLLLAPFYRLWPDPRLFLIVQSLALGLGALPLYWIAREQTRDRQASFIVAVCYLAYPALGFLNLVDFHPVALSVPLLLLAYWALEEERTPLFWISVVLALATKEELVVPIGAWGLVNLLRPERRRLGLGLLGLSALWAGLSFGVIIPHYNEGKAYRFWELWSHLPFLPSEAVSEGGTAQQIGGGSAMTIALFLIHLFLPLGFLPFLGHASLAVALPSLVYLLLGKRPALHSVGYQYPAVLIPWFFLAVVEGLGRLRKGLHGVKGARLYRIGLAFLVTGTIGTNIPLNPLYLYAQEGIFARDLYHDQIETAMELIPAEAGVATINRFGPQLANRRVLVSLEYPSPFRLDHVKMADYVLLDLVDCRLVPAKDKRAQYGKMIEEILKTGQYRVAYWEEDRIVLLERGRSTADTAQRRIDALSDYVNQLVEEGRPCWP